MTKILTFIIAVALIASSCGGDDTEVDATGAQPMTTITGELTYLQRIALIPDGTATITISDVALQDVAAPVIAETTIDLGDQQIPIPFKLVIDTSDLPLNGQFSLRATIESAAGELEWITDTIIPVDLGQVEANLGQLVLVQVDRTEQEAVDTSGLSGEWNITAINDAAVLSSTSPTLNFADDGTLSGNASCNSISAAYAAADGAITIDSDIAMTLMACDPGTNDQERAVLDILNAIGADGATFVIGGDTLILTSSDGATIEAVR